MTCENRDVLKPQGSLTASWFRSNYLSVVVPLVIRVSDALSIIIVGGTIYSLRIDLDLPEFHYNYLAAILFALIIYFIVLELGSSGHSLRTNPNSTTELRPALWAWAITAGLLLLFGFSTKVSAEFSRIWVIGWFTGTAVCLVGVRSVIGTWLLSAASNGSVAKRAVIYGADERGRNLAKQLMSKQCGIKLIGFIDDRFTRIHPGDFAGPVIGNMETLLQMIRSHAVEQVIITFSGQAENRLHELVTRLALTPVQISLVPFPCGLPGSSRQFTQIGGVPAINIFSRPISGWSFIQKELEDRLFGIMLLVFVAPLMSLIAIAIKLDSSGPVFFKQPRHGFNNQIINVWKFRTMYFDMTDLNCETQTTRFDSRVTRIGHFLRRLSLDELPQLFNVLNGTMSLVGPRPHALYTKAAGYTFGEVVEHYLARHRVKPGITGWAQINGYRGETDTIEKIKKRVEYDLYYIDNWSIWLDFYILIKTLWVVLWDKKAY